MRSFDIRTFGAGTLAAGVLALAAVLLATTNAGAASGTVRMGSAQAGTGGQATVNLTVENVGAPGLGAWTVNVLYDPEVISFAGCVAGVGGICTSLGDDTVRVVGALAQGRLGTTTLAQITFDCNVVGGSDLGIGLEVLADGTLGDPLPIDAVIQQGRVTCTEGTSPPPGQSTVRGDANCDGRTNSIDAAIVLQREARLIDSVPCPRNADANRDNGISSLDAVIILQINAGLIR